MLRALALSLPAATDEITWGHPTFRIDGEREVHQGRTT